jgi:hypothetical protein
VVELDVIGRDLGRRSEVLAQHGLDPGHAARADDHDRTHPGVAEVDDIALREVHPPMMAHAGRAIEAVGDIPRRAWSVT